MKREVGVDEDNRVRDAMKFNYFDLSLFLDLKQELKIRNISLPSRPAMMDTSTISEISSPSKDIKNSTMDSSNVSKLNDLNDSKNNNNLSLNASMDKNTSTLSLNNSSMLDMTLHNASCGAANATSSTQKSHNDSFHNKSSQSVLKCMCY